MPTARPLTAIVSAADTWERQVTAQEVTAAGFAVLAEATNAVEALHQNKQLRPSLIVMANEHAGLMGIDAVPELREVDPPPEIILITTDQALHERATELGVFDLSIRGDPEMLARLLVEARELLETGERRKSSDRRTGDDRREKQDWSKVTTERRAGKDRRAGLRREQDVTSTAKEILKQKPPSEG